MLLTAALIIKASLMVPDAKGHLNYRAIPKDGADAIVMTCAPTALPIECAALMATLAFRESNNNPIAEHDHDASGHARGCGAFGVLCTFPHATWAEQTREAWAQVLKSTQTCTEPLALYASGSCTRGLALAREYMAIARRIAAQLRHEIQLSSSSAP